MNLFPAKASLEFGVVKIFGKLIETPRRNEFLLVLTAHFSKLMKTVPLSSISAEAVVKAIFVHSILSYELPI